MHHNIIYVYIFKRWKEVSTTYQLVKCCIAIINIFFFYLNIILKFNKTLLIILEKCTHFMLGNV